MRCGQADWASAAPAEATPMEVTPMEAATVEAATVEATAMVAMVEASMEVFMSEAIVVMEMVEAIREEDRASGEERWAEVPWGCPIVRVGIRIGIDRLWRQRVDLRRHAGCVLGDLPVTIRLLARLPDGLLLLASDRHRRGELAAVRLRRTLGGLRL